MKVKIKVISEQNAFVVDDQSKNTICDYYEQLADNTSTFIKIGNKILQKSTIEYIDGE